MAYGNRVPLGGIVKELYETIFVQNLRDDGVVRRITPWSPVRKRDDDEEYIRKDLYDKLLAEHQQTESDLKEIKHVDDQTIRTAENALAEATELRGELSQCEELSLVRKTELDKVRNDYLTFKPSWDKDAPEKAGWLLANQTVVCMWFQRSPSTPRPVLLRTDKRLLAIKERRPEGS